MDTMLFSIDKRALVTYLRTHGVEAQFLTILLRQQIAYESDGSVQQQPEIASPGQGSIVTVISS